MYDGPYLIRWKGKLTANNELSGDVTAEGKAGEKTGEGTFTLAKQDVQKAEPDQRP